MPYMLLRNKTTQERFYITQKNGPTFFYEWGVLTKIVNRKDRKTSADKKFMQLAVGV